MAQHRAAYISLTRHNTYIKFQPTRKFFKLLTISKTTTTHAKIAANKNSF